MSPISYFQQLTRENRLCVDNGFIPVFCSGPDQVEGVFQRFRKNKNFVVIDDTTDNNVHYSRPGWFTRQVYTVWVIAATDFNDSESRDRQLNLCRTIFKQFLSRMIRDKHARTCGDALEYLDLTKVFYRELGRYSFNGATGLYFMLEHDVPENLCYDSSEWLTPNDNK